jgi:hypothetical protein
MKLFIFLSLLLSSCASSVKQIESIGEFESVKVYKAEGCTVFAIKNSQHNDRNYYFSCPKESQ